MTIKYLLFVLRRAFSLNSNLGNVECPVVVSCHFVGINFSFRVRQESEGEFAVLHDDGWRRHDRLSHVVTRTFLQTIFVHAEMEKQRFGKIITLWRNVRFLKSKVFYNWGINIIIMPFLVHLSVPSIRFGTLTFLPSWLYWISTQASTG